jgi:ABC-type cobalt transport system substrate-binding protein
MMIVILIRIMMIILMIMGINDEDYDGGDYKDDASTDYDGPQYCETD